MVRGTTTELSATESREAVVLREGMELIGRLVGLRPGSTGPDGLEIELVVETRNEGRVRMMVVLREDDVALLKVTPSDARIGILQLDGAARIRLIPRRRGMGGR